MSTDGRGGAAVDAAVGVALGTSVVISLAFLLGIYRMTNGRRICLNAGELRQAKVDGLL